MVDCPTLLRFSTLRFASGVSLRYRDFMNGKNFVIARMLRSNDVAISDLYRLTCISIWLEE